MEFLRDSKVWSAAGSVTTSALFLFDISVIPVEEQYVLVVGFSGHLDP